MRRWKSQLSFAPWICLVLLIGTLYGVGVVGLRVVEPLRGAPETWPVDLPLFGQALLLLALLILAGGLAYRLAAALTLRYELDRNGLYIVWLGNRAVVPLDSIQHVDLGVAVERLRFGPIQWIGYYWGQGRASGGKLLHLFSTRSPARSLAIHTLDAVYSISPVDRDTFVQELEQRRNLGATKPLQTTVESRIFLYDFWNDRAVRTMLLVAFALNLLVLALLSARYPELAPTVEMRFNAVGDAAELRPRHQVLFLPLAAFGLSVFNTGLGLLLYRSQQLGARLLQGTSIVVQILFGIAVVTIIR